VDELADRGPALWAWPSVTAASPSWWQSPVRAWRWLLIVAALPGVAAGVVAFVWPDVARYAVSILVDGHLVVFGIVHIVTPLAGPKLP
jgi:uncharacterized membrane protein HdeD (DUF308 family)